MSSATTEQWTLLVILWTSAAFSVFGCVSFIVYYVRVRPHRSFSFRLLVYFSVASLGGSLSWYFQQPNHPTVCQTGAALTTFFYVCAAMWSCCMAFNLYKSLARDLGLVNPQKYEKYYFCLCLIVPGVCMVVPLSMDLYTKEFLETGIGCWFKEGSEWARLAFFDGPILTAWLYIGTVIVVVHRELKKMSAYARLSSSFAQDALNNQVLVRHILGTFIVCWIWSVLLAILANIPFSDSVDHSFFWMFVIFAILGPLQGFLNFMIYIVQSSEFRKTYFHLYSACFPCCFDDDEELAPLFISPDTTTING